MPAPLRLRELLERLVEAEIRFVLVGGLAVNAWGYRTQVVTELGTVDILQGLPQIPRFADLDAEATDVKIEDLVVRVCSYEHLVGMKRASERPRDRDDLEALEASHEAEDREG